MQGAHPSAHPLCRWIAPGLQWEGDGDAAGEMGSSKTIDFVYDPDSDTPGEGPLLRPPAGQLQDASGPPALLPSRGLAILCTPPGDTRCSGAVMLSCTVPCPAGVPTWPGPPPLAPRCVRCADEIAAEISSEFHLSDTDRDICAAALKEWLDRGMEQQR